MTDQDIRLHDTIEDESHLFTPIAPHQRVSSIEDTNRRDNDTDTLHSYSSTIVPASEDGFTRDEEVENDEISRLEPRTIILPVPTSASDSPSTDALTEAYPPTMLVSLDTLPPEAAEAPISVGGMSFSFSSKCYTHTLSQLNLVLWKHPPRRLHGS